MSTFVYTFYSGLLITFMPYVPVYCKKYIYDKGKLKLPLSMKLYEKIKSFDCVYIFLILFSEYKLLYILSNFQILDANAYMFSLPL